MGSECQVETVVESPAKDLGRLVSLRIDGVGDPHIAYSRVTNRSPLNGVITYARGSSSLDREGFGCWFQGVGL